MLRNTSLEQTIEAKHAFERELLKHNVTVKAYRADNGRFADAGFKTEVKTSNQVITYYGVGVYGQNGIVERYIGKITTRGRIMLLHAKRFWPEAITHMLWPFAIAEAINMENNFTLDADGCTPLQNLTATDGLIVLRDQHPWGFSVYVLESKVQASSKGIPKWEPRARIGVYLGRSPTHASNVALVLNPLSNYVLPQFHVIFDDSFTLIPALCSNTVPDNWADLVTKSAGSVSLPDLDSSKIWFNQAHNNANEPESGFDATFHPRNINCTTTPPTTGMLYTGKDQRNDTSASEGASNVSEGTTPDLNTETLLHLPLMIAFLPQIVRECSITLGISSIRK